MDASQIWIVASLAVLAVVALLVFRGGRAGTRNRLTPLSGLALGCIVAGIVFGKDRWLAYGLFAVGVILAVVDMVRRSRGTWTDTGSRRVSTELRLPPRPVLANALLSSPPHPAGTALSQPS